MTKKISKTKQRKGQVPQPHASKANQETKVKFLTFPNIEQDKGLGDGVDEDVFLAYFTSDKVDEVGDIIERQATTKALKKYRQWRNIRYMHQARAVGRVMDIGEDDGLEWNQMRFRITHDDVIKDINAKVLSGTSVGIIINDFEWMDDDDAKTSQKGWWGPMRIQDYDLVEISVVDHPANYDAMILGKGMGAKDTEEHYEVIESIDPSVEYDVALTAFQFNKERFQVHVDEESEVRTALVRRIEDDILFKMTEDEGIVAENTDELRTEWTAARTDLAKDLVFAVVEPTGEKDDGGKTDPVTARHLPHHDLGVGSHSNDNVDLLRYRDAVGHIDQIEPVTASITSEELRSKAVEHMEAHRVVIEESFGILIDNETLLDEDAWGRFTTSCAEKEIEVSWESWNSWHGAVLKEAGAEDTESESEDEAETEAPVQDDAEESEEPEEAKSVDEPEVDEPAPVTYERQMQDIMALTLQNAEAIQKLTSAVLAETPDESPQDVEEADESDEPEEVEEKSVDVVEDVEPDTSKDFESTVAILSQQIGELTVNFKGMSEMQEKIDALIGKFAAFEEEIEDLKRPRDRKSQVKTKGGADEEEFVVPELDEIKQMKPAEIKNQFQQAAQLMQTR